MPTYRYKCANGHELEEFEPMTAPAERPCPNCPPCWECEHGDINHKGFAQPVMMKRVIGTGAGVIWKHGPPTRKFHK